MANKLRIPTRATPLVVAALLSGSASPLAAQSDGALAAQIARIERGLLPSMQVKGRTYAPATIEERLRTHNVPAVSIAVVNNGRIEWARAYGMADVESKRPATTSTLFQAASISKPVTAIGALRLVQEGKLALDEDVNVKLTSWKVPSNEFTAKQPVTLRLILQHAAGLTVHGFPGYAPGVPVPTVAQLLSGEKPANTAAVRADIVPGSRWRYSGGGTTVMQQLMTDVTGEPFPQLMKRLVLDPVGMTSSTYEQPLPASRAGSAATAYRSNGTAYPGRYHTYPEMAAAGLWTTPTDLAKYIIAVQQSFAGKSSKVLSKDMTASMLTPGVGSHGLGPGVNGTGDSLRFSHGGSNAGFRANYYASAKPGRGVVIMTNGDQGGAIIREVSDAIAREYGWPVQAPRIIEPVEIAADVLRALPGRYVLNRVGAPPIQLVVAVDQGIITVRQNDGTPFELIPTGPDELTPLLPAGPFRFVRDSTGVVTTVLARGARFERQP